MSFTKTISFSNTKEAINSLKVSLVNYKLISLRGKEVPLIISRFSKKNNSNIYCFNGRILKRILKDRATFLNKDSNNPEIWKSFIKEINPKAFNYLQLDKAEDMKEVIYLINNEDIDLFCPICNNRRLFVSPNIKGHYDSPHFLKTCGNPECTQAMTERTNIEKYGYKSYFDIPNIHKEMEEKRFKEKGYKNPFNAPDFDEKRRKTSLQKYGEEIPSKSQEVKNKMINTWKERFEGGHPNRDPKIKEKSIKTWEDHYGVTIKSPFSLPEVREKKKQTLLKRFGVDAAAKSPQVMQKMKETCKEKYGTEYYITSDICRKNNFKSYLLDDKVFDSSFEVAFYIYHRDKNEKIEYHPFKKNYKDKDGKKHVYTPDFLLNDTLYEIKGIWIFNKEGEPFSIYHNKSELDKYLCMKENNVVLLQKEDIKECLNYVKTVYGKDYLKSLKIKSS